ncbi:GGDEF domain-containing response regulator [Sulfurimonas autotrophica]|uniref:diguanylate cyclase n=1 Tax=Sulfurimonas autotrophica (strain ATCC BAA-671 / DSM 16294 / JCM 11897 / OK10) TaxID=563040 RepID=E0UQP5_SULAO|nr:diguanylate cyclase [Sulfurimonas autotrophica]ADN09917.1 response regulator receiver modulated diguanylate cyclase [Sulfurimonas autotrophica DSM 16294]
MHEYAKKITILYVEDEDDVREGYSRALKRISAELYTAHNGIVGLELFKKYHPDIIVSDINMPKMNGLEMVRAIKEINLEVKVIFTTAHSESAYLLEAIELQVEGYLLKPVQKKALTALIKKLAKSIIIEREYEEQREVLQYIIDSENSISVIASTQHVSFASKSFLKYFGVADADEFNEKYASIINIFENNEDSINTKNIKSYLHEGKSLYDFINFLDETQRITIIQNSENEQKSFLINISQINETQFLMNFTDVTEIEKQREEITKKANHDMLTGLYNRNKFEEVFEYELSQVKRYGYDLSLAIADIDHFKFFNDTYGHLIGDEVLKLVANSLTSCTRSSDTLARWGGEEFVMLFSQTSFDDALVLLEKCRKLVEGLNYKEYGKITLSFGVTSYKEGDTLDSMLQRADEALYEAKANGRNKVIGKE